MGRGREAMENAKERYSMWVMTNIRNPRSIYAAFDLIECCIHLEEYVDAELFARTAYEIINERTDNIIPVNMRQQTLARGAYFLATTTCSLAKSGGIAPEAKEAVGVKSTALAREALAINTRLYGAESAFVAGSMTALGEILAYFNDVDDDEVLRLYEQSKATFFRLEGSLSVNVAVGEFNLATLYDNKAQAANDQSRIVSNLHLALPHYREAARIFTAINHIDNANQALREIVNVETILRQIESTKATRASADSCV